MTRIIHFSLRDPNCGDDELAAFREAAAMANCIAAYDDSGPGEGDSPEWPRATGLGTVVLELEDET